MPLSPCARRNGETGATTGADLSTQRRGGSMKSISIAFALLMAAAAPALAANIVELWDDAEPPPKPDLQPVSVKAATTALLIVDMQENSCKALI